MKIIDTSVFLAQSNDGAGAVTGVLALVYLALGVLMIASIWKIFSKAGQPGWAAIVPFYNVIVLIQVAGRPVWWFVLMLIPFVNAIIGIIVAIDLAKAFGKGAGFAVGLIFLPFIFYPMLGLGGAQYQGAPAAIAPPAPPADPPAEGA